MKSRVGLVLAVLEKRRAWSRCRKASYSCQLRVSGIAESGNLHVWNFSQSKTIKSVDVRIVWKMTSDGIQRNCQEEKTNEETSEEERRSKKKE